ncbi:hypothetical protein BLOT_008408 [Blomia tropicalis]|nr:hypothetical protein BLOT_008408 [Blomia tropicalis]
MDFDNFDNLIQVKGYYVHGKKLGEGGFGVWEKILFRVKTEIEALKILHDSIAKLLQVIEDSINIYLVMEYCSGGERITLFYHFIGKCSFIRSLKSQYQLPSN